MDKGEEEEREVDDNEEEEEEEEERKKEEEEEHMYPSHLIFKHGYIVEWCRVFLCHLTQVGEKCCHVELEQRTVSLPAHSTNRQF